MGSQTLAHRELNRLTEWIERYLYDIIPIFRCKYAQVST